MSSKAGLRLFQTPRFTRIFQNRRLFNKRWQTTDAAAAAEQPPPPQGAFQRLWNSPVGIKTVHFWAPVMKWSIVLAGISDFARPAESLSVTQNLAITATGCIWTRWCFIIKPRNLFLAAVNFFLGCVGITQLSRIYLYRQSIKNVSPEEAAKADAKDAKDTAESIVKNPEGAVKQAVQ